MKKIVLSLFCLLNATMPGFCESPAFFVSKGESEKSLINGVDFSPLAEYAASAVVDIQTEQQANVFLNDPFFHSFFMPVDPRTGKQLKQTIRSSGSAVVISPDGYLITCAHVVEKAENIIVHMSDHRQYKAVRVALYPDVDLAILKITESTIPKVSYLKFGLSKTLKNGKPVAALGNAFALGQTFTTGVVSEARRRLITAQEVSSPVVIQHSAAVNPGNSGGALVDHCGNLVGLNNAIYSKGGGSNGVGFAIPADLIMRHLNKFFKKYPDASFGLGALKSLLPDDLEKIRSVGQFPYNGGVLVSSLESKSPLAVAGVKEGDIIVSVDGEGIEYQSDLFLLESITEPGVILKVVIWRDNKPLEMKFTVAKAEVDAKAVDFEVTSIAALKGIIFTPLSPKNVGKLKIPPGIQKGIYVKSVEGRTTVDTNVEESTFGFNSFLSLGQVFKPGDLILSINKVDTVDKQSFVQAMKVTESSKQFSVLLVRNGAHMQMQLNMPIVSTASGTL